jgi:hypothetical protein
MKVLFAIRSPGFSRFFIQTIRDLSGDGHAVEVLIHYYRRRDPASLKETDQASQAALIRCEAELKGFRWGPALRRNDAWKRPLFAARKLLDYGSYTRPGRQASQMVIERSKGYLHTGLQRALESGVGRSVLVHPLFQQALRAIERLAPADPDILAWLRRHRPDVVVASPVLMTASDEVEYVKAAKRLGIPTVVAVMSWDNLTTKGLLHAIPDLTVVWNQGQIEEAVRFHHVPPDRVLYTGAPVFDEWFNLQPTLGRAAFCRQAGLDPAHPFVLYLCSSWSIAQNETTFVEQVARSLREHPGTRHLRLLVRPHPSNSEIWANYPQTSFSIWPPNGVIPSTQEARQDFYHALHFSVAALGINTSALIETAIVDRPCISILAERYRDTQQNIAHFQHLLRADFLELAPDIPAAADVLAAVARGQDARRPQRRRFIAEFVRPWGLNRPASPIMASVITAVAERRACSEIVAELAKGSAEAAAASRELAGAVMLSGT